MNNSENYQLQKHEQLIAEIKEKLNIVVQLEQDNYNLLHEHNAQLTHVTEKLDALTRRNDKIHKLFHRVLQILDDDYKKSNITKLPTYLNETVPRTEDYNQNHERTDSESSTENYCTINETETGPILTSQIDEQNVESPTNQQETTENSVEIVTETNIALNHDTQQPYFY